MISVRAAASSAPRPMVPFVVLSVILVIIEVLPPAGAAAVVHKIIESEDGDVIECVDMHQQPALKHAAPGTRKIQTPMGSGMPACAGARFAATVMEYLGVSSDGVLFRDAADQTFTTTPACYGANPLGFGHSRPGYNAAPLRGATGRHCRSKRRGAARRRCDKSTRPCAVVRRLLRCSTAYCAVPSSRDGNLILLLTVAVDEVDWSHAPAREANFDLNIDLEEEKEDEDGEVYADDFHVVFDEEELPWSDDEAEVDQADDVNAPAGTATFDLNYSMGDEELDLSIPEEQVLQGSQTQSANTVIKRKNLSNGERQQIYEAVLMRSVNGTLKRRTTTIVANLFNVNRRQVQSIWSIAKECLAAGVPVDVSCKRKSNCGRKKMTVDMAAIAALPLDQRTTLRAMADALGVKKTTVHRWFKEGKLRRHSNTLKPYLKDANKKTRLQHCLSMLDGDTLQNAPKFINMKNIVHIDEKWFNTTKKAKKFYMLPEEEDPLRTIHNKNSIPKCMLLCAVTPPRQDAEGTCYFDGKLGIWPFVRQEPAQRSSRNREKGTLIAKSVIVTRDVSRQYLITKVLPAIVAKWPREGRRETVWIQQDNARTHIDPNDEAFCLAVQQTGLDIRIFNQPPNSPDLNVLDLGFFASLQSKTFLTSSRNMDELINNVQQEFSKYDPLLLRNVFLTLQGCMIEIMKKGGGNGYKIPHMKKDALEAAGMLPTSLSVNQELYHAVLQILAAA
ncbi:hypothetical protein ACP4OV_017229 [Aristida adscensionis]